MEWRCWKLCRIVHVQTEAEKKWVKDVILPIVFDTRDLTADLPPPQSTFSVLHRHEIYRACRAC